MWRCMACTALITPVEARATANSDYYQTEYTLTHTSRTNTEMHRYFRYPEYATLIGRVLNELEPSPEIPRTWLDVGCDHGFFLDDVRRYGFSVVGVEPSTSARAYAQSIGIAVEEGVSDVTGKYAVISLWHVLEHIDQPRQMLHQLYEQCEPGGVLCIRVPDASSFWARMMRDRWIWFQARNHVVHYSPRTLQTVVEDAGFQVAELRAQKPNTWLTRRAYRLSWKVFSHTHGRARPSLRDRVARWYQDVTGCELFVVARKPQNQR